MLFLNASSNTSLPFPSIVRLLTVAVSGGTPIVCGEATPVELLYTVSPSSLIETRFPLGTCGHDSASWFRIALALPLFWIVIERFLPLATLFVTDSCAGVGGAGGHGFAGELCRTLMFGMTVHLPATGDCPNVQLLKSNPSAVR